MRNKFLLLLCFVSLSFNKEKIDPTYMATFGSVTLNDKLYNQVSFRPEFTKGKLGVGLDFYIYFDEEGNLYNEDWDFSSVKASFKTIIDKIYYIRYGQPFNDVYFRIGALPDVTMGHGILVRNYANNMDYPQVRRIGFDFRYTFSGFRLELLHSDLKQFNHASLVGVRATVPIIEKLDIGISVTSDVDQINGLLDTDSDTYPDYVDAFPDDEDLWHEYQQTLNVLETVGNCDHSISDCSSEIDYSMDLIEDWIEEDRLDVRDELDKNDISAMAIDLTYKVSDRMMVYSEFAQLSGKTDIPIFSPQATLSGYDDNGGEPFDTKLGYGYIPIGIKASFNFISFAMDYRRSSKNFMFHYWDKNYDHNRIMIDRNNAPITKESQLYKYGKQEGFNFGFIANISKYLKFSVDYLYMKGDMWSMEDNDYVQDKNNSFYSKFEIDTSRIPRIRIAEIFYQQTNTPKPFDFEPNENTLIGYNFGMELANNMTLIFKGRKTYVFDGEGYSPVKNTQIETSVYF